MLAQPQDLSTGRLILTVIAGRLRKVRMAEGANARGNTVTALPLSEGDLLDLRAIEQGLENLRRVPTAEADIEITPSEEPDAQAGDSDLVVQYRQAFPFRFSASLDDGGARTTGRHQAGVTVAYDNWWTLNDLFYASLTRSLGRYGDRGSRSHTVHYSLPFGYWLLSATLSGSRYHQTVEGAFEPVVYSGHAETSEVKLSHLLRRNATSKSHVAARLLLRKSFNFVDQIPLAPQQRRMAGSRRASLLAITPQAAHRQLVRFDERLFQCTLVQQRAPNQCDGGQDDDEDIDEIKVLHDSPLRLVTIDGTRAWPFRLSRSARRPR